MRAREIIIEGQVWSAVKRLARGLFSNNAPQITIQKRAIESLANSMMEIKKTDYDSIDRQMKMIGKEFKISPKKLHDLWVRKYGTTPDAWIAKRV
jgi:hypothetical protein